jgi:hypothetical protein
MAFRSRLAWQAAQILLTLRRSWRIASDEYGMDRSGESCDWRVEGESNVIALNVPQKYLCSAKSPEARSWPIGEIILGVPLGIGQPDQHFWSSFPRNPSSGVQVAHRVTGLFELAKDRGDLLSLGRADVLAFVFLNFALDPEAEDLVYAQIHYELQIALA